MNSDWCDLCQGARQTSSHLCWDCPHFFVRRPFLASLRAIREYLYGAQPGVASFYDYITTTAAWRCWGIAGESAEAIVQLNQRPSADSIHRRVDWEHLIFYGSLGATYFVCCISGKRFINVYGDGSVLFGNSVWHTKAAWGIWVGNGNPANAS